MTEQEKMSYALGAAIGSNYAKRILHLMAMPWQKA